MYYPQLKECNDLIIVLFLILLYSVYVSINVCVSYYYCMFQAVYISICQCVFNTHVV